MTTVANLTVKDTPSHATGYQWMWSVIGHPTIQAAITKPGNFLRVDWYALFRFSPKSLWKAIKYNEHPYYSSAVMLTKVTLFYIFEGSQFIQNNKIRSDLDKVQTIY